MKPDTVKEKKGNTPYKRVRTAEAEYPVSIGARLHFEFLNSDPFPSPSSFAQERPGAARRHRSAAAWHRRRSSGSTILFLLLLVGPGFNPNSPSAPPLSNPKRACRLRRRLAGQEGTLWSHAALITLLGKCIVFVSLFLILIWFVLEELSVLD